MFNTTECDLRYAAHAERVARIDRAGWLVADAVAKRPRQAWTGALIARTRRWWPSTLRMGRGSVAPLGRGLS